MSDLQISFTGAAASVAGFDHVRSGINCQDASYLDTFEVNGVKFIHGGVMDGCGSGDLSELGSISAKIYIRQAVKRYCQSRVPIHEIPGRLFKAQTEHLIPSIANLLGIDDPETIFHVIMESLLYTHLFFLASDKYVLIASYGDGVEYLNGEITKRDASNVSDYFGYTYAQKLTGADVSFSHEYDTRLLTVEDVYELGVGTDAWIKRKGPILLPEVMKIDISGGGSARLGFKLNQLAGSPIPNRQFVRGSFDDDTSLAMLKRI